MLDPLNKAVTRDGGWIQSRLLVPGGFGDIIDVKPSRTAISKCGIFSYHRILNKEECLSIPTGI